MAQSFEHTGWRERWLSGLLLFTVVVSLLACIGGGLFVRSGRLPSFYKPVWFAEKQALIFYSGSICPVGEWRAACDMGLTQRMFSISYWTPGQSHVLVRIAEQ